jgi:signal transduction histidine kinase
MNLRIKIGVGFAAVAIVTAAVIAIAVPPIVGRGFGQLEADAAVTATDPGHGRGNGSGNGNGPGPMAAEHAAQIQQDTTIALLLVALLAAAVSSAAGFIIAGRMARPLSQLADASHRVAGGDFAGRSGLSTRTDEFGEVGRSFDEMAAALQLSDEERRRFIQDAVHELRTPVTVIDGTAGALEEGIFAPEPRHLRTIREQSQLLGRIVDDLRTIGLAEAGQLELDRQPVDVAPVVESTVAAFAARAQAEAIVLESDVSAELRVQADPTRLRQVLAALTDNALRHTPHGGRVRIAAARASAAARISVEDSGAGIASQDLPYVFDRFYQADRSRDRRTGTSGLGLSIVRALVEAQGGRVGAENGPEGGARVWIELPFALD